jgi:hypothetical protein
MHPLVIALVVLLQALASIEGLVTKPGGTAPLAGARVTLRPVGIAIEQPTGPSAISEDDGRFTVRGVPPGDYTLSVESQRYGAALYGQRRHNGPGTTLSLTAGQRLTNIRISMISKGAIAGRITGRNGEPVVQAMVQAFQYAYRDGKRALTPISSTTADDRGEYRLFGLAPGPYLVAATLNESPALTASSVAFHQNGMLAHLSASSDALFVESFLAGPVINRLLDDGTVQQEAWIPVYYPGTIEARQATTIEVLPGATMSGINVAISPAPVRKVSGQVIGPPGSAPTVTLTPESLDFRFKNMTFNAGPGTGTSFEFAGLSPGVYTLLARDSRTEAVSSPMRLEVGDRDIENLTVALISGITLAGRVVVENSSESSLQQNPLGGLLLTMVQGTVELRSDIVVLQPSGSFLAKSLSPGTYFVRLMRLTEEPVNVDRADAPKPPIIKSIRLGQTDVSGGIPITATTQDRLEIVVTTESSSITGTVIDSRRMPAAGATVVLVPATARRNATLYDSTISDASGRFRLQGIVPGDYLLFAWEDVEPGAWRDPGFLRPFESLGRLVRVQANNNQVDAITMISNP